MSIITLTSDWGTSDYYLAAVKGTILAQLPDVSIVDISHHIQPFDVESAAFTIRNCYKSFPAGTVHIIGLNSEESVDTPHIILKSAGQYFVGADNGIFSMIFEPEHIEAIIEIDIPQDSDFFTFSSRDRFAKVAVQIIKGTALEELGDAKESCARRILFQPTTSADTINGLVIHVDAYENLITNISEKLFREMKKGRSFEIYSSGYRLRKIHSGYMDVGTADLVAIFGSHGMLEIAINQGKASSLCGIRRNASVVITFSNA
ncbi:MAG: SAM-dependent chlorinase/fluorinase [Bacteroidetes bacterium]|jgi:S-adenosylmethionine hydrolase|nr:SAM-dependent chlorinase/fluorinase [Bacteroidota bacterium]MDA3942147.1 SAM-dependent chlorinase/fluorinase [Bacteroidota bacterium]